MRRGSGAPLIDGGTDTHLWAETYDRDLQDIVAVQSEVVGGAENVEIPPYPRPARRR